jgi:hypothetical protein
MHTIKNFIHIVPPHYHQIMVSIEMLLEPNMLLNVENLSGDFVHRRIEPKWRRSWVVVGTFCSPKSSGRCTSASIVRRSARNSGACQDDDDRKGPCGDRDDNVNHNEEAMSSSRH